MECLYFKEHPNAAKLLGLETSTDFTLFPELEVESKEVIRASDSECWLGEAPSTQAGNSLKRDILGTQPGKGPGIIILEY